MIGKLCGGTLKIQAELSIGCIEAFNTFHASFLY